jgi:hypothetical protein
LNLTSAPARNTGPDCRDFILGRRALFPALSPVIQAVLFLDFADPSPTELGSTWSSRSTLGLGMLVSLFAVGWILPTKAPVVAYLDYFPQTAIRAIGPIIDKFLGHTTTIPVSLIATATATRILLTLISVIASLTGATRAILASGIGVSNRTVTPTLPVVHLLGASAFLSQRPGSVRGEQRSIDRV